jgi:hypothetical protein
LSRASLLTWNIGVALEFVIEMAERAKEHEKSKSGDRNTTTKTLIQNCNDFHTSISFAEWYGTVWYGGLYILLSCT